MKNISCIHFILFVGYVVAPVNEAYAKKHNYSFASHILPVEEIVTLIHPRTHCSWYKVLLLRHYLAQKCPNEESLEFSHVVWIDADAVVVKCFSGPFFFLFFVTN